MRYLCALLLGLFAVSAGALTYPTKPVRLIHGYPGTSLDAGARIFSNELQKRLGQPFIVDARPGANGTIAVKAVVAAAPDGYTLFYGPVAPFHPVLLKTNAVDASKELATVADVLTSGYDFIVRSSLGIKTFPDLVAYSKANPGKLNFGSPGSVTELQLKVLEDRTGLSYTVINFKGGSPIAPLLAGDIDFVFSNVAQYAAYIQAGKVVPLFGTRKNVALPSMPTATEVGISNFNATTTTGFWTSIGAPREAISKLNTELSAIVKVPETVTQLNKAVGQDAITSSPEEQLRNLEATMAFWREAVRLAKYEPQ